MENEDSVITMNQSAEEAAAEEAAFSSAFNEHRGIEEHRGTEDEPVVAKVEEEEVPLGDGEVVNEEVVEPVVAAEPARLIGGLTEDQIAAALARSGSLQSTVDKMAGRIGNLMQQIEALKAAPPTTQAAQHALDLKLEKLSGAFPELATLLREDLAGLQQAQAASPAPAGITQEQFDAAMNGTKAQLQEQMEVKILTIQHPDWLEVIKTPQFALFRDNVLPAGVGQELMRSEDSAFISSKLSEFKKWRDKAAEQAPTVVTPIRRNRLANAVLPSGSGSSTPKGPQTEEEAFAAGFKNERARGGY